ncbi:hypothetical protein TNCV_2892461 [Trichonephila clavipes]|nr:hypothetical protein TNCV_2892461 [Trichonephila clavipes]
MTPHQGSLAQSSVVNGSPVVSTRACNCTSCNLLHMVWVDMDSSAPEGNRLRMSRTEEKVSRIVNWQIRWSVRCGVHMCAPLPLQRTR